MTEAVPPAPNTKEVGLVIVAVAARTANVVKKGPVRPCAPCDPVGPFRIVLCTGPVHPLIVGFLREVYNLNGGEYRFCFWVFGVWIMV